MAVKIIGTGSYLPPDIIDNDRLSTLVETNDEWITEHTGIKSRHIAKEDTTASMAMVAAKNAIADSQLSVDEIDLIIVATVTPDNATPSVACQVQAAIGAVNSMCFDISAACSGFIYALTTARAFIESGIYKNALVCGSETLSNIVDWSDRNTCILFADGAGACVVSKSDKDGGIIGQIMHSDGVKGVSLECKERQTDNFLVNAPRTKHYVKMDGGEIFKFAVKKVPECIGELLEAANTSKDDIKYYVLHQANARIISQVARRMKEDIEKFPMNVEHTGNTSGASIPILLDEINKKGMLNAGDKIVLCGFGGGLTWGAVLIEW